MNVPKLSEIYHVPLLRAGWQRWTDRFYPKSALKLIERQFQPPCLGEFLIVGDVAAPRVDLSAVSHRTNKLYLKNDGDELWAEVQTFDVAAGRAVQKFHEMGKIRFECLITGVMNRHDEVDPETINFLRVVAYGVY